jgi:hypothetical protein
MKGNHWCRDQYLAHKYIIPDVPTLINRSEVGSMLAKNRVDRDNHNWEEYLKNRNKKIFDAHLWRPGYTEDNIEKIIRLLTIMYPEDSFDWVREYAAKFRSILNKV